VPGAALPLPHRNEFGVQATQQARNAMTKFGVGQAAARIEDRVLVTGAGAYTDDTSIDGQAWACVLRSPHAHARILGIDSTEAAAAPGVIGILTGADMTADGLGDLPCLVPLENRDGSERHDSPHGILAGDRVRYVGHPVALVVAETLAQARDAAECSVWTVTGSSS